MGVALNQVPAVLILFSGRKKVGESHTVKKLEIELNLGDRTDIIEALSSGAHPLFKGLDLFEQAAADGGGPYDLILCRKVGPVCIELVAVDKNTQVVKIDNAKLQGKWKIHLGANMETMRSRLTFVGGVARELLPKIDDYTGCDIFVSLRTLQTDVEEAAAAAGGKPTDKGTRKVQLDVEEEAEKKAKAGGKGDDDDVPDELK